MTHAGKDHAPITVRRRQVVEFVRERGYERRAQPFKLASGQWSHDYVDGKYAVDSGDRLLFVSKVAVEVARSRGMDFNAVGGLTMGADALAHGIAIADKCLWFSVRKEPKSRGREQWIEGGRLGADCRVLLVDDVVTTGGSIMTAFERVTSTGAKVVGVITLVDRGEGGKRLFDQEGIPYAALVTYRDLGIEPVGGSPVLATTR